ncbi:hypothetical protein JJE66_33695 [Bradyrhizobium diazoefficiens]|uniref:hypothetical protein n=1 Tax=Bradyrhizobium diazoefficiens TaxID=1355477 RepID=UPI0019095FB0|nr:hypothetical protein [Bradyrhizobium diazoefficiens]MBK3666162.1 hypothetical protein [Bradyrhizobium diazoefficiens]
MKPIGKLIQAPVKTPKRVTERGELFDKILIRLNVARIKAGYKPITHKRFGYMLTKIPTKDLYALISRCDDAERRGYPWSAIFYKEIKPTKTQ